MKIETLVNLTGGELLNSPFISEVVSFTQNADEVSRGSCFFATDVSMINKAVKNGAYAVVLKENYPVLDEEIAWIKIDNFEKAVFDIFKYENLKNKLYFTDKITSLLIKKMSRERHVVVIENDFKDLLKAININEKFLITSDTKFMRIFPNIEKIKSKKIIMSQKTLFKSIYKNAEINLPYIYKNNFAKAINFFENKNLKYSLEFQLERFKPVFIDSNFFEVEYGKSEKVLITGLKNDEFLVDELNFIIKNTKHANTVIIDKRHKQYLEEKFNFAVLIDTEINLNEKKEKGLFDG